MNGILNILKPAGMTSNDVVLNIRRITGEKRAGHTGTLDPNACGVLPVCLGNALRLIEYGDGFSKSYRCECIFGYSSDTQDVWGSVKKGRELQIDVDWNVMLSAFQGEIEQLPPSYSALKINGRRAYDLARQGKEFELQKRKVYIHKINYVNFIDNKLTFDVDCSKGTYIRSLCTDIGNSLDADCIMSSLIRISASGFDISETAALEQICSGNIESFLFPSSRLVSCLLRVEIPNAERRAAFRNGLSFFDYRSVQGIAAVFDGPELIGIAEAYTDAGKTVYKPVKVLI